MKPTKKHIADKALILFNEKGFVHVRLQHIADAAFVSVGHLAYYFRTKEAIIEYLYDDFRKKQNLVLAEYRFVPLFDDINRYFVAIFNLQSDYIFFYTDALEIIRTTPLLHQKYCEYNQWQFTQLSLLVKFNEARGALVFSKLSNFNHLVELLVLKIATWRYAAKTSCIKEETLSNYVYDLWSSFKPYLTDMGQREFDQMENVT